MDHKPVILATLRQCVHRLEALERAHCDGGAWPIFNFPCLRPLIDEIRDVIRLVARPRGLVPRRR